MEKFNNLSEAEKFAFSSEFLTRFKLIKKLRPEITQEKDILAVVANEFYDNDLKSLVSSIKFIDSKCKIDSLDTVDLDEAIDAYSDSLEKEELSKEKLIQDIDAEVSELQEKEKNKKKEVEKAVKNFKKKRNKEILIQGLKCAGLSMLIFYGVGLIATYGIMGIVGAVLSWIPTLTTAQVGVLALVGYWGFSSGGFKKMWGSIKKFFETKATKREEALKNAQEKMTTTSAEQKELSDKITTKQKEKVAAENDHYNTVKKRKNEQAILKKVKQKSAFDDEITVTEGVINSQYNTASKGVDSEEIDGRMKDAKDKFIASLYQMAYKGQIKTRKDLRAIIESAKVKFGQLSNPLNVDEEVAVGDTEEVVFA